MQMKRTLFLLLLTLTAATSLHAYDFQVGCFQYNITNDTLPPFTVELAKLEDGKSKLREIVIPETIAYHDTTYIVTRIGRRTFYECPHITSITLPQTIDGISDEAFYHCRGLKEITIPDSVQYIGFSAFEGCENLTSVVIPRQVSTIGSRAFMKCSQLSSIAIPESVNSVGQDAFKGTPWYDSLPDGVVYINNVLYAYKGNTMMANTAIKVRNGTTAIVDYAFEDCIGLTSIALPKTITTIGTGAFAGCTALSSIVIPKGVTHIERITFKKCYSLAHVLLPESLTHIGNAAFQDCRSLVSINIPQTVQRISDFAFQNCYALTEIHLSEGLTNIGGDAFSGCSSLTSITIPNSVTIIAESAFQNCTSLSTIEIPNNITMVGKKAFMGTAWYQAQPDGEVYINNILYTYKGTMPKNTVIVIKEGTVLIADYAFVNCVNLTSVSIPNTVTKIGICAFSGCENLKTAILSEGVTNVGHEAFVDCNSLKEVIIPKTVTTIGNNAFFGTLWYKKQPNGFVYINDVLYARKGESTQPTSYAVREGTVSISLCVFSECEQLKSVTLPASLRSIDSPIFSWQNPPEYVVCWATTPPAGIQKGFTAKQRLYVPDSAIESYKAVMGKHVKILPLSEKPNE